MEKHQSQACNNSVINTHLLYNCSNFVTIWLLRGILSIEKKKSKVELWNAIIHVSYMLAVTLLLILGCSPTECKGISNEARSKNPLRWVDKVTRSTGAAAGLLTLWKQGSSSVLWPPGSLFKMAARLENWHISNKTISTANGSIRCNFGSFYLITRWRKFTRNCPSLMVRDGNNC